MNRRGFLSAFGKAVVAGPIAVTQIGKPAVAATIENGVATLKPGAYRALVVDGCTFSPAPFEEAIRISHSTMNVNGGFALKMSHTVTTDVSRPAPACIKFDAGEDA